MDDSGPHADKPPHAGAESSGWISRAFRGARLEAPGSCIGRGAIQRGCNVFHHYRCLPNPSPRAARLDQLGPTGRLASTDLASSAERPSDLGGRYPEEVPTVNGEVEWIGLMLADLD